MPSHSLVSCRILKEWIKIYHFFIKQQCCHADSALDNACHILKHLSCRLNNVGQLPWPSYKNLSSITPVFPKNFSNQSHAVRKFDNDDKHKTISMFYIH